MKNPDKGPSIRVLTDPPIRCLNLLRESLTLEELLPRARHSEELLALWTVTTGRLQMSCFKPLSYRLDIFTSKPL